MCSAKIIVKMIHEKGVEYQGDIATILDWVFYHDSLIRFSLSHWRLTTPDLNKCQHKALVQSKGLASSSRSKVSKILRHTHTRTHAHIYMYIYSETI